MIGLSATFPLDPPTRDEALDLIEDPVERSQAKDGMIDYRAAMGEADRPTPFSQPTRLEFPSVETRELPRIEV